MSSWCDKREAQKKKKSTHIYIYIEECDGRIDILRIGFGHRGKKSIKTAVLNTTLMPAFEMWAMKEKKECFELRTRRYWLLNKGSKTLRFEVERP